jgi:drug/metabolite transporter (DMT)-like permease
MSAVEPPGLGDPPGRRTAPLIPGSTRDVVLAHLAVVVAAVLFGSTFLVVKDAVEQVDPYVFLAVRFAIGAAVLAPLAHRRPATPGAWRAGLACGAALATGYVFQTVGLQRTTASVSAFITYLLIVIVPLLSAVVLRRRPSASAIAGVTLGTVGLVLLTGGVDHFRSGELLTLGCAVAFAAHVLLLSELAPRHDVLRLNATQLAVVSAACVAPGLAFGSFRLPLAALVAAAFTGIAASAVALGLQVWAQTRLSAVRVSLLLLIEPVSAALLGVATGEHLGLAGIAGCGVILLGIAVTELDVLPRLRPSGSPPPD